MKADRIRTSLMAHQEVSFTSTACHTTFDMTIDTSSSSLAQHYQPVPSQYWIMTAVGLLCYLFLPIKQVVLDTWLVTLQLQQCTWHAFRDIPIMYQIINITYSVISYISLAYVYWIFSNSLQSVRSFHIMLPLTISCCTSTWHASHPHARTTWIVTTHKLSSQLIRSCHVISLF